MLESIIINILLINKYYNKYINIINININIIKDINKYFYKLFIVLKELKEKHNKEVNSVEELQALFYTQYPVLSKDEAAFYEPVFAKLATQVVDEGVALDYMDAFIGRVHSAQIAITAMQVSEGKAPFDLLREMFSRVPQEPQTEESFLVPDDLEALYRELSQKPGLRWRLDTLNKTLGSLRKGAFGFITARPETGKTTFLASEISHMAEQCEGNVLHINNEEDGKTVMMRYYSAVLGLPTAQIYSDLSGNRAKFMQKTGGRIKLFDKPFASRRELETVIAKLDPKLIVIDQLDKINGFDAERNDLVLKAKYQWARELAKQYGPVIGVSQAGGSGENKRYLDMNDIDSSHTGKQGEADWILGIGKLHEENYEFIRFLSIMKNKLPGDSDSKPELRHAKIDVRIQPEIARYADAHRNL